MTDEQMKEIRGILELILMGVWSVAGLTLGSIIVMLWVG